MRYPAYLEIGPGGHTLGYVFALPGLSVRAPKPEAALGTLPSALAAELGGASSAPIEVTEAERVEVRSDVEHGLSSALFRYELRPTRDEDVALALERLERFRRELTDAADFRALADGEWWLLSRLGTRPVLALPEEPRGRFDAVRAATIARLTSLLPGDRERHAVFAGEAWTTRKVLRRLACLARDATLLVS